MALAADVANQALKTSEVLDAKLNELRIHLDNMDLIALRDRVMALEGVAAELKRAKEESEKRRSQYVFWGIGTAVTLVGSFLVQLAMYWVKK